MLMDKEWERGIKDGSKFYEISINHIWSPFLNTSGWNVHTLYPTLSIQFSLSQKYTKNPAIKCTRNPNVSSPGRNNALNVSFVSLFFHSLYTYFLSTVPETEYNSERHYHPPAFITLNSLMGGNDNITHCEESSAGK